jgi:transcriptional regulator with XRE-family HTH domain
MRGFALNGPAIQTARQRLGLTQEQFAAQAQCDVKTVRKAEKSGRVDAYVAIRLASVLQTTVEELTDRGSSEQQGKNCEVVAAWIEAFNQRDPGLVAELFDEEGAITVVSDVPIPGSGEFRGKSEIYSWAKTCFATYHTQRIDADMHRIISAGDVVFVYNTQEVQVSSMLTDRSTRASAMHEFFIRNGKILTHRIITNTASLEKLVRDADAAT